MELLFKDLPERLKEQVIEQNRDINVDDDSWHDYIVEDFEHELNKDGVGKVKVSYTGFWSQGDGASFTGKVEDTAKFVHETLGLSAYPKEALECLIIEFTRNSSRYVHENSCDTEVEIDHEDGESSDFTLAGGAGFEITRTLGEIADHVQEKAEEWRIEQCGELYSNLEEEYEGLRTDEAVVGTIEANDYTYEVDEDGNLVD
jgi:hypothetical protein